MRKAGRDAPEETAGRGLPVSRTFNAQPGNGNGDDGDAETSRRNAGANVPGETVGRGLAPPSPLSPQNYGGQAGERQELALAGSVGLQAHGLP